MTSSVHPNHFVRPEILVVDDDPDILIALLDLLESEGYVVTGAATCREALLRTQTTSFDAVLLDIGLPDGDGLSVLAHLHAAIPSLPVIMLTAVTSAAQRADALARGAFSYLAKPYHHDELRALICQALGMGKKSEPLETTRPCERTGRSPIRVLAGQDAD